MSRQHIQEASGNFALCGFIGRIQVGRRFFPMQCWQHQIGHARRLHPAVGSLPYMLLNKAFSKSRAVPDGPGQAGEKMTAQCALLRLKPKSGTHLLKLVLTQIAPFLEKQSGSKGCYVFVSRAETEALIATLWNTTGSGPVRDGSFHILAAFSPVIEEIASRNTFDIPPNAVNRLKKLSPMPAVHGVTAEVRFCHVSLPTLGRIKALCMNFESRRAGDKRVPKPPVRKN